MGLISTELSYLHHVRFAPESDRRADVQVRQLRAPITDISLGGHRQRAFGTTARAMVHERPVRVERRLSAILVADVAGYSRLMHRPFRSTT